MASSWRSRLVFAAFTSAAGGALRFGVIAIGLGRGDRRGPVSGASVISAGFVSAIFCSGAAGAAASASIRLRFTGACPGFDWHVACSIDGLDLGFGATVPAPLASVMRRTARLCRSVLRDGERAVAAASVGLVVSDRRPQIELGLDRLDFGRAQVGLRTDFRVRIDGGSATTGCGTTL